jgi:hypothetical protein
MLLALLKVLLMNPEENDSTNEQGSLSQTGPNELNEEDLGLSEHDEEPIIIGQENVTDNDQDKMEDPVNDLDEEEVKRLFPGEENVSKDSDLEDLNKSV